MMHRTKHLVAITRRVRFTLRKGRWWVVYFAHASPYDVR